MLQSSSDMQRQYEKDNLIIKPKTKCAGNSLHWLLVKGFCQTSIPFRLQYTNTESEQFALAPLHVDIFTRTPCSGFWSSTNKQTKKTYQLNAGLMIYHRFACINVQSLPYSEIMVPFIRRSGEYSIDLDYYTAVWKCLTLNFHKNIRTSMEMHISGDFTDMF
jgi:hypothetical protein